MAQSIKPYAMLLVLILLLFVSTSVLVGIANARPLADPNPAVTESFDDGTVFINGAIKTGGSNLGKEAPDKYSANGKSTALGEIANSGPSPGEGH